MANANNKKNVLKVKKNTLPPKAYNMVSKKSYVNFPTDTL